MFGVVTTSNAAIFNRTVRHAATLINVVTVPHPCGLTRLYSCANRLPRGRPLLCRSIPHPRGTTSGRAGVRLVPAVF
jgi:hypothetical protein